VENANAIMMAMTASASVTNPKRLIRGTLKLRAPRPIPNPEPDLTDPTSNKTKTPNSKFLLFENLQLFRLYLFESKIQNIYQQSNRIVFSQQNFENDCEFLILALFIIEGASINACRVRPC
jgi:hypothetical protein